MPHINRTRAAHKISHWSFFTSSLAWSLKLNVSMTGSIRSLVVKKQTRNRIDPRMPIRPIAG